MRAKAAPALAPASAPPRAEVEAAFTAIDGVGPSKAVDLYEHGFERVEQLAAATPDELAEISGVGSVLARKILDHFSEDVTE